MVFEYSEILKIYNMKKIISAMSILMGLGIANAQQAQTSNSSMPTPPQKIEKKVKDEKNKKETSTKTEMKKMETQTTQVKKTEAKKPEMKKTEVKKVETKKVETKSSSGGVKLKKDGTPDKRYKESKKMKKDGTPDMRYKENKK